MARPSPYPPELRERAVRMVAEIRPNYPTEWVAMKAVAAKLSIRAAETVRTRVRKTEVDADQRPGVTSDEAVEIKRLRAEMPACGGRRRSSRRRRLSSRQCQAVGDRRVEQSEVAFGG
jgi:transposase